MFSKLSSDDEYKTPPRVEKDEEDEDELKLTSTPSVMKKSKRFEKLSDILNNQEIRRNLHQDHFISMKAEYLCSEPNCDYPSINHKIGEGLCIKHQTQFEDLRNKFEEDLYPKQIDQQEYLDHTQKLLDQDLININILTQLEQLIDDEKSEYNQIRNMDLNHPHNQSFKEKIIKNVLEGNHIKHDKDNILFKLFLSIQYTLQEEKKQPNN